MARIIDSLGRTSGTAPVRRALGLVVLTVALLASTGCEIKSFLDPSVVGRWDRTPVVLPILDRLDVIDEPASEPPGLTQILPEDLVPEVSEYVIGPGDLLTISVFELIRPDVESVQTRRVDELGMVRLPEVGAVKVDGLSPSQLEARVAEILDKKGKIRNATVSVIVQETRQRTFSVIGESSFASTAIGTYQILKSDFRLLDAMALARGVPGSIKKLYVIRQVELYEQDPPKPPGTGTEPSADAPGSQEAVDPAALIQELLKGVDPGARPTDPVDTTPPPAPAAIEETMKDHGAGAWVNVDGQWVRTEGRSPAAARDAASPEQAEARARAAAAARQAMVTQRIIEVPYDRLLAGETQFNIVIRPGDVIRVPAPVIGNVYIGGAISRPGTYGLPGDRDLTLKQLVFAAGNLSPIAMPGRVDLIRRIGRDQEAVVRLNLRAIFDGEEPDLFLKPNDTINIGTSFIATPLAVVRNGLRASYGFGFILDRNFEREVFGNVNP